MFTKASVELARYIIRDLDHDADCAYWLRLDKHHAHEQERCDCWYGKARRLALQVLNEDKDTQGSQENLTGKQT